MRLMRTSSQLKHRTLSSAITDQLRQAILDGSYPSGTQLRQDALAETFGVSRIPVREALFQLEAEGLLVLVPHKGAVVSGLSQAEINDVFDLRALLEPRLLAASGPLLGADAFTRIEQVHERFVAAVQSRDIGQWGALNAEFHMTLYAAADMPKSIAIVAGLLQTSDRYTRLQLSNVAAMQRAEREHRELIAFCRNGDFATACGLLEAHVQTVRHDLIALLAAK